MATCAACWRACPAARRAGGWAAQYASSRGVPALLLVLGLAVVSVCAVMLVQFESFVEPLVVLLVAPLSFVGGLLLLIVTGTPIQRLVVHGPDPAGRG